MKSALLVFLLFVWSIICLQIYAQKKTNRVLVYGTIKNFKNVIEIEDKDYTEPFQITNSDRSFVPDSFGRFSVEFHLDEPKYFRIARNIVFLSPGDQLNVSIDYNMPTNSTFRGSHSQEDEYLKNTLYPKAGSFLQAGTNVKATIDQTLQIILDSARRKRRSLSVYKNLSSQFRFLENSRINADVLNSFYSLRRYFPYIHKLNGDSLTAFEKFFPNFIDDYAKKNVPIMVDARLLKLEVYRDIIPMILKLTDSIGKDVAKINDWLFAKQMVHEMQTESNSFSIEKISNIRNVKYRNEVLATYKKLSSFNGNKAIDLAFKDSKRKIFKLSFFRDKIIFIDIWATWCGPCIKEQSYLDSLKERYKNNSNIVFLSLSIDRNINDWEKYISKTESSNFQFIIDLETLRPYYISEIPRTIIIDRNFNVYAMRGPMPSSSESIDIIQRMLKEY